MKIDDYNDVTHLVNLRNNTLEVIRRLSTGQLAVFVGISAEGRIEEKRHTEGYWFYEADEAYEALRKTLLDKARERLSQIEDNLIQFGVEIPANGASDDSITRMDILGTSVVAKRERLRT